MDRRRFLKLLGIVGTSAIASVGCHSWVARSQVVSSKNPKRLVVIFLRGGIDGLNVVIPYAESDYYEVRPVIAVPKPGEDKGAFDLDGNFGLHPALAPLMPLWKQGSLAFVHACGSPDPTRSHFDAQAYMEAGLLGTKKLPDGWMNRVLAMLPAQTPVEAVSVGSTVPRILLGQESVANIGLRGNSAQKLPIDRNQTIRTAFDQLYASNDPISLAYQEGIAARDQLLAELEAEMTQANNGAPMPTGFAEEAHKLGSLIARDPTIQLAFMHLGGWDTHTNQGSATGQLANRLKDLGKGVKALVDRLGSVYSDTAIVVVSEFGRTVRENGNQGTDHGHGNVMWLLGGSVEGGKVYGDWPGLSEAELYEGRDLAITTDFREVFTSVLNRQFGLRPDQMEQVFPGYRPVQNLELFST